MRPELCIGCGICERECPVMDDPAVYVTVASHLAVGAILYVLVSGWLDRRVAHPAQLQPRRVLRPGRRPAQGAEAVLGAVHEVAGHPLATDPDPLAAGVAGLLLETAGKIEAMYGHSYDAASEVTITAGATQAIITAILAVVRPGDL